MNTNIDTSLFEQAEKTANSCIEKYTSCIASAEAEFNALNAVWDDEQYTQAKLRFDECKKYILDTIEVLNKMKAAFHSDIEATNVAASKISGIWGGQ